MHAEAAIAEHKDLVSLWQQLAEDPDAPDRCEITRHEEIVLTPPPSPRHQGIARRVMRQLEAQLGGETFQEVPVLTDSAGIRCPDVVWLPDDRVGEVVTDQPLAKIPPLVVEVLSPRNRKHEMAHKIGGYLDSGAQEVIVIGLDGKVTFHRADGPHLESAMGVRLDLPAELFA